MMLGRRFVHLATFVGLAVLVAVSVDRVVQPSILRDLALTAGLAAATGLPGLVHRRLALLTLVTVPLGLYLLLRLASPLPDAIDTWRGEWVYYSDQLRFGMAAYSEDIFPLTLRGVPGLELLVLVGVYLVVALASVLALDGQHPLLGVGVLLGFLAVSFTVDGEVADTRLVAIFVLTSAFLLLTSQALSRRRWGLRDAVTGLGVGGAGLLIAYFLLTSNPGIAVQGWQDWHTWDPFGSGPGERVAFTWNLNYPRMLDPRNEVPVFRVRTTLPTYWRADTLELFNGRSWLTAGQAWAPLGQGPGVLRLPPEEPLPPGEAVSQRFLLDELTTTVLFAGGSPQSVSLDFPTRLYASPQGSLHTETPVDSPYDYTVEAHIPRVQPSRLVGLGRDYPLGTELYLTLPLPTAAEVQADPGLLSELAETGPGFYQGTRFDRTEYEGLYDLNARMLDGATDPYEQTLRIERYLRTMYRYSTDVPSSDLESPIAAFLLDTKTGYCQHFAGGMALLLRLNGIPSRVAVGFTTGEAIDERTYQVTSNNAHAWVEAYFPGIGWLPFDPTPGRSLPLAGASVSSPGFVDPFPHQSQETTATATPTTLPGNRQADQGGGAQTPVLLAVSRTALLPAIGVMLALVATLICWPLARRRVRERRLHQGDHRARVSASLDLLRRDLAEGGVVVGPATTLPELADRVRHEGLADLQAVVARAEAVLFGGRAADAEDVVRSEEARRTVALALRGRNGRLWAMLSRYGLAGRVRRVRGRLDGVIEKRWTILRDGRAVGGGAEVGGAR